MGDPEVKPSKPRSTCEPMPGACDPRFVQMLSQRFAGLISDCNGLLMLARRRSAAGSPEAGIAKGAGGEAFRELTAPFGRGSEMVTARKTSSKMRRTYSCVPRRRHAVAPRDSRE